MVRDDSEHLRRSSRRFAVRAGIATWLGRHGFPRIAMAAVLAVSAAVGWGSSLSLHHYGMKSMWLRLPLAVAACYATFLLLVGLMVRRATRRLDIARDRIRREALRRQYRNDDDAPDGSDVIDGVSDAMRDALQEGADPRAIPVFLTLLLAVTVILICAYYIWTAPFLLAELTLEGALATWLYRPVARGLDANWLSVALEKTAVPFLTMALCFSLTGLACQLYAPQATTVVEAWDHVLRPKPIIAEHKGIFERR